MEKNIEIMHAFLDGSNCKSGVVTSIFNFVFFFRLGFLVQLFSDTRGSMLG